VFLGIVEQISEIREQAQPILALLALTGICDWRGKHATEILAIDLCRETVSTIYYHFRQHVVEQIGLTTCNCIHSCWFDNTKISTGCSNKSAREVLAIAEMLMKLLAVGIELRCP